MTETVKKYMSRLTVSKGCCPSYWEGKAEGLRAWQWETKAVAAHTVVDQGSMGGPRSRYNLQMRGHTQLLAMPHLQRVPHTPKQAPSARDSSGSVIRDTCQNTASQWRTSLLLTEAPDLRNNCLFLSSLPSLSPMLHLKNFPYPEFSSPAVSISPRIF